MQCAHMPACNPHTPRNALQLKGAHLDVRVVDRAAVLLRGVIAEHAAGDVAVAGAAEDGAAGVRGVAVELAVVHVACCALRLPASTISNTCCTVHCIPVLSGHHYQVAGHA